MTEPPLRISGSAFCTVNSVARALRLKVASKFSSVILPSISDSPRGRIRHQDVQPALFGEHRRGQLVQVGAVSDVAGDGAQAVTDQRFGLVQLASAAARDEDVGAFDDEPLCSGQPDTAAATGDHGDLASQSCHQLILQFQYSAGWLKMIARLTILPSRTLK